MASTTSFTSITPTVSDSDSSRLIDLEPSVPTSKLQVIVVGRPGAGTDALSDALKHLGYKVYDLQAAGEHHERDFGLWHEAARLRKIGNSYSRDDYDKIIGDHDALVCAPTCTLDHEFIGLYRDTNVKVIMLTGECGTDAVNTLLNKVIWLSRFNRLAKKDDAAFFDFLHEYAETSVTSKVDKEAVRKAMNSANLLELDSLTEWDQLCTFLQVKTPIICPLPKRSKFVVGIDLFLRPIQTFNDLTMIHGEKLKKLFVSLCVSAGFTISGRLTVRESTPAAAAIVFGMCLMATTYWHRRTVHSSSAATSTNTNTTSAPVTVTSSEAKTPAPKIQSKAFSTPEFKIPSDAELLKKLPASALIPPRLRQRRMPSSETAAEPANTPKLSEASSHSEASPARPAGQSRVSTPPHVYGRTSPAVSSVNSRSSVQKEGTLTRSVTSPLVSTSHLRISRTSSPVESVSSAQKEGTVTRPQTPPSRPALPPLAYTPSHLRKSLSPTSRLAVESTVSKQPEATIVRPQTPSTQAAVKPSAYTPPHLRKSSQSSVKLATATSNITAQSIPAVSRAENISFKADNINVAPASDTSPSAVVNPQPVITIQTTTPPRPKVQNDRRGRRGPSATNGRNNTRNNTRNARSRASQQPFNARNSNASSRSAEPAKPRVAAAGAWGNFAVNIADSDKASQAMVDEKSKQFAGHASLITTYKGDQ